MKPKHFLMNLLKPVNLPITKYVLKKHYENGKALSTTNNAKRILVLAPHADDETIGPGGVIRKHANDGAEIHCAFITDGSNSVSDLSRDELIEARLKETEAVRSILGIHMIHYLGLPDGHVFNTEYAQGIFQDLIDTVKPDIIYCTSFIDAHPDHTATAGILASVLENTEQRDLIIRLYEVNCPIPPEYINCVMDISETLKEKEAAVDVFASQTIAFDGFIELNKKKAQLVHEDIAAAEVFFEPSIETFVQHCKRLEQDASKFKNLFKQANRTDTLMWAIYKNLSVKKQLYEKSLNSK
ncbi:hypothetical protein JNUCC1_01129 [Lentibacillus sp. JNUCC-1]|uniref:PIG-L deacetylase family protein n=1 Tax=Lentibacillus sp. JNUCC-1 TaxID=2654513 RepID=UPI0012E7C252|nr:PIG-L family deacetylase [Lentibacillus sp. JNUCC-1]MUV37323.1 hypothetical protein [Lentibacillus sp. JNUCC-1]